MSAISGCASLHNRALSPFAVDGDSFRGRGLARFRPGRSSPRGGRSEGSGEARPTRSIERTRSRTVSDQSSLSLTVTTAEGDTVALSVEARSLAQSQSAFVHSNGTSALTRSQSAESSLEVPVSVEGDLNASELADIQQLLGALSSGDAPATQAQVFVGASTINSFDYAFWRSVEVQRSEVQRSSVAVFA